MTTLPALPGCIFVTNLQVMGGIRVEHIINKSFLDFAAEQFC
jgi:hypothetical protein